MCHTPTRHDLTIADLRGMSFKEPIPALSNVMDTKDNVWLGISNRYPEP